MGSGKKEAARKERQGKVGDGMANVRVKGENFYRNAKKIKTLNMFKEGKAQRNARGEITKAASYQSREKPSARVEPNRKWFTNTRVISQESLEAFRGAIAAQQKDPHSYLLKSNKLPMSLLDESKTKNGIKQHQAKITVEGAPFADTFGPKAQRKRPKLAVSSLEDLAGETVKSYGDYEDRLENVRLLSGNAGQEEQEQGGEMAPLDDGNLTIAREPVFSKGQSKRIWNELYKVIDSSDVVVHVLDARDPLGTRCRSVEKYIKEEAPHKHLLFVLNKCDLVPTSVAAQWVRTLSKEYPTLAFHASITNSFGKGSLISLLRQFSALHSSRKQISVGFIGYPNTGKSSIINTLRKKKVCTVAPIPGETKVWQYITLMKRIYLIDCPGVVPPNGNDTPEDILLRGVVRVENVENPEQYVAAALKKCRKHHVERTYDVRGWETAVDFLEALARKGGRLLRGGEADMDGVAKMVLNDFLRGKIPWFTPPPATEGEGARGEKDAGIEGRHGVLGEMSKKRKRGVEEATSQTDANPNDGKEGEEQEPEFAGFGNSDAIDGADYDAEDTDFEISDSESDAESVAPGTDAATLVASEQGEEVVKLADPSSLSNGETTNRKKRRRKN
ncbi:GTPase required for pre-60S ribosomal subunit nuclear export and maturation [Elasticomyces elasticus]|nr:GTPase required for pre-60S ribosomal subunit nuclear export and maturation [Elasticomyces elasticus]KAK5000057.1 GTPase required for pre-60S ribosomal subunit nuclear export and maturation [Elasticomyces elasticus]